MNSQQEYEKFLAKFSKTVHELKNDFNNLSHENQQRITQEANAVLREYGRAITFEDLMQTYLTR